MSKRHRPNHIPNQCHINCRLRQTDRQTDRQTIAFIYIDLRRCQQGGATFWFYSYKS